jgi:UDP-2-acetamido-3-amino-2,3-dideoxy-glucuronate N-acetyltransferase
MSIRKNKFFKHPKALVAPGAKIGSGTRIWAFSNIQKGAVIGKGCNICDGCFVERGAKIGNHVTIKNGVNIFEGVVLEDDVFCGMNTAFINDRYPRSHREDAWTLEGVLVKKGATLGSNATILCGITIGRYALVGAGSVVTRDVPDHAIVAGNPARPCGQACVCGRKLGVNLKCSCKREYVLVGTNLKIKE